MELLRSRSWSASSPLGLRQGPTGPEWERGSCTSAPTPSDPARCQVPGEAEARRCGGAEARDARAGGVGRPAPRPPRACGRVSANLPQGQPLGPAAPGGRPARLTSTGARVRAAAPAGAVGSAARAAGISGARRAGSPPAAARDLRARGASAAAAPGQSLRGPSPRRPCPPPAPRTCAALRDQLAGPLGDGVHGAEGPAARALTGTHALPSPPPGLALGGGPGRGPFNGRPGAAGRGRAATRPRPLKGPRVRAGLGARGGGGAPPVGETGCGGQPPAPHPTWPTAKAEEASWGLGRPSTAGRPGEPRVRGCGWGRVDRRWGRSVRTLEARLFPFTLGSFSQGAWVGLSQREGSFLAWVLGPRGRRPEKVGLGRNLAPWESPLHSVGQE